MSRPLLELTTAWCDIGSIHIPETWLLPDWFLLSVRPAQFATAIFVLPISCWLLLRRWFTSHVYINITSSYHAPIHCYCPCSPAQDNFLSIYSPHFHFPLLLASHFLVLASSSYNLVYIPHLLHHSHSLIWRPTRVADTPPLLPISRYAASSLLNPTFSHNPAWHSNGALCWHNWQPA